MPTNERVIYRLRLHDNRVAGIDIIDAISRKIIGAPNTFFLFPAKHFVTPEDEKERAVKDIKAELGMQLKKFERSGKLLEAERIKRRTNHDLALIREIGYCNGIENYSRHFDGRKAGEPPSTLLSYFPKTKDGTPDFLTVVDESHVTLPQLGGMYAGDRSRKETLVEHGFRLPSAVDNRPLTFEEFEGRVGQLLYTSATPGSYEYGHSEKPEGQFVEQVIRPTGLIDPEITVKPIVESKTNKTKTSGKVGSSPDAPRAYRGQVYDFIEEAEIVTKRGGRVLVTTLTKRMAEDLAEFLK
ncbi:MAG: UvrABC system protein B, partial [Parcubacteria group bacterium GW2011_GWA2_56_21]